MTDVILINCSVSARKLLTTADSIGTLITGTNLPGAGGKLGNTIGGFIDKSRYEGLKHAIKSSAYNTKETVKNFNPKKIIKDKVVNYNPLSKLVGSTINKKNIPGISSKLNINPFEDDTKYENTSTINNLIKHINKDSVELYNKKKSRITKRDSLNPNNKTLKMNRSANKLKELRLKYEGYSEGKEVINGKGDL
jgi:hypothetical protein